VVKLTLEQASKNIGRLVTYRPYKTGPLNAIEGGLITSVNDKYVFVRYGSDINAKATRAEDLFL